VPSFDLKLVTGVATYGLELFRLAVRWRHLCAIGMGSGVCGTIAARNALGLATPSGGVCRAMRRRMRCRCCR